MICIDAAKEVYNQSFVDQTSTISNQTLASPSADTTYRVSFYSTSNFFANSSTARLDFALIWDDEFDASGNFAVSVGSVQSANPPLSQGSVIANVKAGGSLTLRVTQIHALNAGDKYSVYVVVEEL